MGDLPGNKFVLLVLLCFGQKVYNEKKKKTPKTKKKNYKKKVFAIFEQHEQHKLNPWEPGHSSRAPLDSQEQHKSNTKATREQHESKPHSALPPQEGQQADEARVWSTN